MPARPRSRRGRAAVLALGAALALGLLAPSGASADPPWYEPVARPAPEAEIGVSGEPFRGTAPDGTVRGYVDLHNHLMSYEGFGGRLICGRAFSEEGIADALQDCPEHYPNGELALFENATGGASGTHDPVGWPTFPHWPDPTSLTHQQNYYAWLERARRGGQRVVVNLLVSNGVICSIAPRDRGCDEMESIRLQAQRTHELEAYVDAQYGGEGRGWFRVVSTPDEAREVVEQGKLAVVLGVETSEPFGCKQVLGVPQCDEGDIDRGLDEMQALGVSSMFLCHKFDNALCGVRFDEGTTGTIVNVGQFISTGTFWTTETCTGPYSDNPIDLDPVPAIEDLLPDGVGVPTYPSGPRCNTRGLTDLGEYALRGMVERGMVVEVDHMSVKAATRAFEVLEAEQYPGVVSSHSWMDEGWTQRLHDLGGFSGQYPRDPGDFVQTWQELKPVRDAHGVGLGLGTDFSGFGDHHTAESDTVRITYPFTTWDGSVVDRQVTGERTFDLNTDGFAMVGMTPDYVENLRTRAGQGIVDDLARGAEGYLRTWSAARAHEASHDLASGRPASASSTQWDPFTSRAPGRAVDGDRDTRWASAWTPTAWWQVDLGTPQQVGRVGLEWEGAYATGYRVDVSDDGATWRTVWSTTAGDGGLDTAAFEPTTARFVRVHATQRATSYGYSLWDVRVHAT